MKLKEQHLRFFSALTKDREENAKTMEKPSMRGVKRSVVDKYSDQAHFIYELLQNADDAKATKAKFILNPDGLIFRHNGTVHFTVSDPTTEGLDTTAHRLGHINAITSIANSNKDSASIGKFGVGFKAVFQYTDTPHIYDQNFWFKIERFVVPQLLSDDFPGRQPIESLFFFPFDLEAMPKEVAFADILQKLKSLVHPLLFLPNLKEVTWETTSEVGKYTKTIKETKTKDGITSQLISLQELKEHKQKRRLLWLFTKQIDSSAHQYSIGYFLDKNQKLEATEYPAFCFFPTKETTNLKFILQAPFLLTDSREGIKAGEEWNRQLIQKLALLSAETLPFLKQIGIKRKNLLIEDSIINILPYDPAKFEDLNSRNKISFLPFFSVIKSKLQNEVLLPANRGRYVAKSQAYWASDTELTELFTDKQLAELMEDPNARWVFPTIGRKQVAFSNKELLQYIDGGDERKNIPANLIVTNLDPQKIFRKITTEFIEHQSFSWIKTLYKYLLESPSLWDKPESILKNKPIFINEQGKAVAGFDKSGKILQLFIPFENETSFQTISNRFLNDASSMRFFDMFGIGKPKLKDEIFNIILPRYIGKLEVDDLHQYKSDFVKFFTYYQECSNSQLDDYINQFADLQFIVCKSNATRNKNFISKPSLCYFPSKELKAYFSYKAETPFVDIDFYLELINSDQICLLETFLLKLGVCKLPIIFENELDLTYEEKAERGLTTSYTRYSYVKDSYLDGCQEIIDNIDKENSVLLWNYLLYLIKEHSYPEFKFLMQGVHIYYYHKENTEPFDSEETIRLTTSAWLINKEGRFVAPTDVSVFDLNKAYDTSSTEAKALIEYLELINPLHGVNLTDEQRRVFELGAQIINQGITQADIEKLKRLKNIISKAGSRTRTDTENPTQAEEQYTEEDEFTAAGEKMEALLERLEQEFAETEHKISKLEELQQAAIDFPRYTYGWFKALLGLEQLQAMERSHNARELAIHFGHVVRDPNSDDTIILSQPSYRIPIDIEEIENLTVVLRYQELPNSIKIEAVQHKNNQLLVKISNPTLIRDIRFEHVDLATISIKDPGFLLETLSNSFERLAGSAYDDNFNMQLHLPRKISFVFGPPGTGKTTRLARYLRILMGKKEDLKVLVLTPTNRAADELCKSVIKGCSASHTTYADWLFRFVQANDPEVQPLVRNRDKPLKEDRAVLVSTIARFPFDGFHKPGTNRPLREEHWDVVIFDEASMIGLAPAVYAIYQSLSNNSNCRFVIGGDPFQIEPIQILEDWKNDQGQTENIYTMVGLNQQNSFEEPDTVPHSFKVHRLMTQYRSLPDIGELFSSLTYNGLLQHARRDEEPKATGPLDITIKPITFIPFPVRSYTRLYKASKLGHTPYHIHSAILAAEMTVHLAKQIQAHYMGMEGPEQRVNYKIGIVCPYRAQASLIENLINKLQPAMPLDKIDFQIGTVHTFQGGECDIVLAVFNPPATILHRNHAYSRNIFLNKLNLLNVAISRARDYMLVLLPDGETKNIQELLLLEKLTKLAKDAGDSFTELKFKDVEKILFKEEEYLAKNSFVSSHQSVNVYRKVKGRYEIRCDDTAIDVQIITDDN